MQGTRLAEQRATNHSRYAVAFLSGPATKARLAKPAPDAFTSELFHFGERETHLWRRYATGRRYGNLPSFFRGPTDDFLDPIH